MVSFIRNVSFDCSDPYTLAEFWSAVIGQPIGPECLPGDTEVVIEPADGPRLFF
jgi:Glyoxalase-like domain